jgi:hypothetical protein
LYVVGDSIGVKYILNQKKKPVEIAQNKLNTPSKMGLML